MRLIDAEAYPCAKCGSAYCVTNCDKYWVWFHATVDAAPKWISVEDRLPEAHDDGSVDVVLVTDDFFIHMAYFNHGIWRFCESGEMKEEMFYNVTHWMPLPELPKEGNIEG